MLAFLCDLLCRSWFDALALQPCICSRAYTVAAACLCWLPVQFVINTGLLSEVALLTAFNTLVLFDCTERAFALLHCASLLKALEMQSYRVLAAPCRRSVLVSIYRHTRHKPNDAVFPLARLCRAA